MIRGTWVWDRQKRELVPKHMHRREPSKRSSLPAPMLISDTLADVMNPVNGRTYSSKSQYYRAVRDAGCEIVGNDKSKPASKKELDDPIGDIKQAIEQVSSTGVPPQARRKRNA